MLRRSFIKLAAIITASAIGLFTFLGLNRELDRELDRDLEEEYEMGETVELHSPQKSSVSIEEAIEGRRSSRQYGDEPLSLKQISQLCWAAQGITEERDNFRSAPSAGALYPIELFVVSGYSDLEPGVYQYSSSGHRLDRIKQGDVREDLARAAVGQQEVKLAAIDIVITGIYRRTAQKYGSRAERYVHLEAGHVAQNIYLQCESLDLATVSIGAFSDSDVRDLLSVNEEHTPLYIMPIGHKG
ncbi:MAG: SagB/ThcOx family dehydrogenase [Archaeoglobaceae archaeon]